MTILASCLAAVFTLGAVFELRPLTGDAVRGTLSRLDGKTVVITTQAGEKSFSLREVARVTRFDIAPKPPGEPPAVSLHLTDGTIWRLSNVALADGRLDGKDPYGKAALPRLRSLAAIRLRAPEGALDPAWEEYVNAERGADALVVRRTVNRKTDDGETVLSTETTLDEIEGKLVAIDESSVKFEVEGEATDIPRERVEGIVLALPAAGEEPELVCVAIDSAGSRWKLQSVAIEGETLKMTSVCGVTAELPLERLTALDFSASNTRYLSDLEMASSETRPYLDDSFTGPKLAKLLAPKRDQGLFGGQLDGGDSPFGDAKGLSLAAHTKLSYRIPKGFTRFSAVAALDPKVKKVGGVMLKISADDRELFNQLIDAARASTTIDFALPEQARMLTIEVDFGPRKELGASLQLRGARLTK
jgi:hypothetical protein